MKDVVVLTGEKLRKFPGSCSAPGGLSGQPGTERRSREFTVKGVADVQAADERTLGRRIRLVMNQGELLRQAARVDRYDDASTVSCAVAKEVRFPGWRKSSIGLENDIHAGDLVVDTQFASTFVQSGSG